MNKPMIIGIIVAAIVLAAGFEVYRATQEPCYTEDTTQSFCTWDSKTQGAGEGKDFIRVFGIKL